MAHLTQDWNWFTKVGSPNWMLKWIPKLKTKIGSPKWRLKWFTKLKATMDHQTKGNGSPN